ncbi:MAG: hypothetical protein LC620_00680 [Halobacteriales archaeon]|nr:hypothetical protein [Halobacteriales archaeon]
MRPLLALALAVALVAAGCTGKTEPPTSTRTCPGGQPIPANVTGEPAQVCPKPAPPFAACPDSYGKEIASKAHQNLPGTFTGDYTFTTPGMYYARVYATILADDLAGKDYWSNEVMLMVADVLPTGKNVVVTHGPGNSAAKLDPNPVDIKLGDGVVLKNDDLVDHKLTMVGCPQTFPELTVPKATSSQPMVFKAPGTCTFATDDLQPQTLTVNVTA